MSSSEIPPAPNDIPNCFTPANPGPIQPAPAFGPAGPSADERTMAMLAELLQLFSWIIGPLIIFFVKRDSPFVRFHALQAILWQVFMMMFSIVFFVVIIAAAFATKSGANSTAAPVVLMLCFYALFGLFSLANFVIAIYFAVKANSGAWASYPVIGRIARSILNI